VHQVDFRVVSTDTTKTCIFNSVGTKNPMKVLKINIKKEYLATCSLAFRVKSPNFPKKLNYFLPHFYLDFRDGGMGCRIFGISFYILDSFSRWLFGCFKQIENCCFM
jgi:hypothetical protein